MTIQLTEKQLGILKCVRSIELLKQTGTTVPSAYEANIQVLVNHGLVTFHLYFPGHQIRLTREGRTLLRENGYKLLSPAPEKPTAKLPDSHVIIRDAQLRAEVRGFIRRYQEKLKREQAKK